ncbi:hypothetical protein [Bifidobacterium saguinibicoloris]|nr:hypothetical protein [Bifidobacterium saguinibicoloris]MBW3081079.1 hypothetical protein [Bifidobacterium saguinibicoloris]
MTFSNHARRAVAALAGVAAMAAMAVAPLAASAADTTPSANGSQAAVTPKDDVKASIKGG